MSETHSYTLTRTVEAPVAQVWEAWTTPDQYAQWAHAEPGSVSLDVRPGGPWKATMLTPDGSSFPLTGSYVEVVENKRIVLGMDVPGRSEQALMTMEVEADGDTTTVTVSQACDTVEERDMSREGSGMLLDGLTSFLAGS